MLSGDVESNPGPNFPAAHHDYAEYKRHLLLRCRYNNSLKFCLLNARNLTSKRLEFERLVEDHGKNSIFAVTETWFTSADTPEAWSVDHHHFRVFVQNRNLEATRRCKGGGVMLLIPKLFNPCIRTDLSQISSTFESLWVECNSIEDRRKRILINVSLLPEQKSERCFL